MIEKWICPFESCEHFKIVIERNYDRMSPNTIKNIILHGLQHLKLDCKYVGSHDFWAFLYDNLPKNCLTVEDRVSCGTDNYQRWKRYIIQVLTNIIQDELEYLHYTKDDFDKEVEMYNADIENKNSWRRYIRTKNFFQDYSKCYDDWEVGTYQIFPGQENWFYNKKKTKMNKKKAKINKKKYFMNKNDPDYEKYESMKCDYECNQLPFWRISEFIQLQKKLRVYYA